MEELEEWVKKELTVTREDYLIRNKDKVKKVIGITMNGEVLFKVDVERLAAREVICLYMIGKVYANLAGYVDTEIVTNKELIETLKMPEGTVKYTLKELRDDKFIVAEKPGFHRIIYNKIGGILETIVKKIEE